jgi:hypothetical protein
MNIITQIGINRQREAISLANHILPPLVTSSTRPCMAMPHKSTAPILILIHVTAHLSCGKCKQLKLNRSKIRTMTSSAKTCKEIKTFPDSII